jgi:3-oxoacyl-[acyl-carrier protein] reductase
VHPVYPDLAGKVVVVAGGSRGIGAATCRLFAQNGARVVVNGRDQLAIDATVESIRAGGGQAAGAAADCTDAAAVERLRAAAEEAFGPADVLAAFVGGGGRPKPILEMAEAEWLATIEVNLHATFRTLRAFLPGMAARGRGAVITMASTAGRQKGPGAGASAAYAVAKAGVIMLTRCFAAEVGAAGVRVNCIAPSAIATERTGAQTPLPTPQQQALFPLGRVGTPDDVAHAALFLASDAASWLTGVTLDVAGGRVML